MSAPRVLLVESLDAAGSDRADARDRCAALRALRAVVRVAVLHPGRDGSDVGAEAAIATSGAFAEWDAGPAGLARLRAFAHEGRFELILIASATPGGGPAARVFPTGAPVFWWPTGVSPGPGWGARFGFGRAAGRPALASPGSGPQHDAPAGLAWSTVGPRLAGRGRLTLWDGEYVLAPLALSGAEGSRLLAAFASLPDDWCALDLVVLSEPQPTFEREARARGVGPRVHFVGRAPREAEWAWWAHASGAVLAGTGAISGGLVLRGLRSGCPIVVAQSDAPGNAIRTWLAQNGCEPTTRPDGGTDLAGSLAGMLERGPGRAEVVERGRALAAELGEDRLPARLAAAIPALAGRPVDEGRHAAA